MHDIFPSSVVNQSYNGNSLLDAIYGVDAKTMKILAKPLSFTVNVKMIVSTNKYLRRLTVIDGSIGNELAKGTIDFWLSLVNFVGFPTIFSCRKMNMHIGTFIYPNSKSILTKQYGNYRIKMSFHASCSAVIVSLITITCVIIKVSILKFDTKVWTLHNVTRILIGVTIKYDPQKVSGRIFFLCLILIYATFSMKVMESFLDIYLYQKSYVKLSSLKKLMDAGIVPYLVNQTKWVLCDNSDNAATRRLCQNSETLAEFKDMYECVANLLSDEKESVKGCQIF